MTPVIYGVIEMNHYYVVMTCMRRSTKEEFEVKIDLEDLEKVRQFVWKVQKSHDSVYAVKQGTKNVYLHRVIYGDCDGQKVYPRNGSYFDCRKTNLYSK
jgi:hypothetical protein